MNRPDIPKRAAPIDLAGEPDFAIGPLAVSPPLRQVRAGERRETIEPRVMQVLVALARAEGNVVSRDALIECCWGGRIVGEDAVNRCIAKVRALADLGGGAAFEVVTIPRVGYRLQPIASSDSRAALPPASAQAAPGRPRQGWRAPAMALAAAMLVAGGIVLWQRAAPHGAGTANPTRIAVLPFEALGSEQAVRLFGDTVAEQIIATLNDNDVQTVPRADAAALRGAGRDEAAAKIGVDFILDGTVQRTPSGLRVTVHLDRASSHATLWTESFDESGGTGLALQSQVSAKVADEIKAVQRAFKQDAGDIGDEALAAYLKAAEISRLPVDKSSLTKVSDLLHEVIRRAPGFTPAYADLAGTSALLVPFASAQDAPALRSAARRWAQKTLALDPGNGDAYWALALLVPDGHWAEEEALYRKGLSVDPNHDLMNNSLADLLTTTGRTAESLALRRRALELDPLSPTKTSGMAWALAGAGRCAEALKTAAQADQLWPTFPQVWQTRLRTFVDCGRYAEARAMLDAPEKAPVPVEADVLAAWRAVIDALELKTPHASALARQAALAARAGDRIGATTAIDMLAATGNVDAAFGLAANIGRRFDLAILFRPETAPLRTDPRFWQIAERTGLSAYWKATGNWPDFCRTAPDDCRAAENR